MHRLNHKFSWQIIKSMMKIIFVISAIAAISSYSHPPSKVYAQTDTLPFPGSLVVEGIWDDIGSGHNLTKLDKNRILDWEPATGQYRLLQYDPLVTGMADPLVESPTAKGKLNNRHSMQELIYLGGFELLNWEPTSGQFQVQQYAEGNIKPRSTPSPIQGTFKDIRSGHKLIYLGHRQVLDWEPATGRYQIWRYDPSIRGQVDSFPGNLVVEGVWLTIRSGHELIYLGNYRILAWEPASGQYRIWRYDPTVTGKANPLIGEPVVQGVWSDIRSGHKLISLGNNRILDWEPASGEYRVFEYELTAVRAFGLEDIATKLENQDVTGVTVITHGWQFGNDPDAYGDSLMLLADDVHKKAGGWLIDYDVPGDGGDGFFDTCTNDCETPESGEAGMREVVLLFDWAPETNELYTDGWGEAAGDALFSMVIGLGLIDPLASNNIPLHFISHSFGAAVTSEVIERLAGVGVPVDHVTYLDPHDFNEGFIYDASQRLFDLGQPEGYGATVWNNVVFADVYYQTRGKSGLPTIDVPGGRPIPGAYNGLLDSELPSDPAAYPDSLTLPNDHSYVWQCFYRATVTGSFPQTPDCPAPGLAIDFNQTGYAFSRIKNTASRPNPNFYSTEQSHSHSEPTIVHIESGLPNESGLASLGLTAAQIIQGRWEPAWSPLKIINGDFENYNLIPEVCAIYPTPGDLENTCPQPGWSHHGGGGIGHFNNDNNAYLNLDAGNTTQTHNWLYVPPNAIRLQFDLSKEVTFISPDKFEVQLGSETLISYGPNENFDGFITQKVEIPASLRGQVTTLTFNLIRDGPFVGSEVLIDNVEFLEDAQTTYLAYLPVVIRQ